MASRPLGARQLHNLSDWNPLLQLKTGKISGPYRKTGYQLRNTLSVDSTLSSALKSGG